MLFKLYSTFQGIIKITSQGIVDYNILIIDCYSARRLTGSRIIESAAYCNQTMQAHLYLNSTQNMSVNWIIRLLLSLLCWPKVILLCGGTVLVIL